MFKFIAVIVAALGMLASSAQADEEIDPNFYANQLPYGTPTGTHITPPAGYHLFFLENVGRHGSRTMTNATRENNAIKVWNAANAKHAVRAAGAQFKADVQNFQGDEVASSGRYGYLTQQGKDEWKGIGERTAESYPEFFNSLTSTEKVSFRTTSVHRTQQSAEAMRAGIDSESTGVPTYTDRVTDDKNLLLTSGASTTGKAAIAKALKASNVRRAANDVLHGLYTQAYIDTLSDPVSAALDIYLIYSTAPGLGDETDQHFTEYMPLSDAKVLAYAADVKNFYSYGPGVSGETSSYKQARPLLKDFFTRLDSRIGGGHYAAVFRLAHGETTMPFEALIRVPGSGSPASKSTGYKYGSNPWRGAVAGRLAGNVEWAVYKKDSTHYLVTMRYNEQPVKFRSACKATASAPYFYRVDTLKDCLG